MGIMILKEPWQDNDSNDKSFWGCVSENMTNSNFMLYPEGIWNVK